MNKSIRIIGRLDIKGTNLIKGVRLEGLRVLGEPNMFAEKYYLDGIDELIFMDSVASLYGRNHLSGIIKSAADNIFVPLTVGGGIRSIDDAREVLRSGADKVAINTAAVGNPHLISQIAEIFGSQCMMLSVEAKKISPMKWEVYTQNGRERTGMDVVEWAQRGVSLGAGEILLTSIDCEGTAKGFDIDLVDAVSSCVSVPVIASGGMGSLCDFVSVVKNGGADAVAIAHMLHYEKTTIKEIRKYGLDAGISLRLSS